MYSALAGLTRKKIIYITLPNVTTKKKKKKKEKKNLNTITKIKNQKKKKKISQNG